MQISNLWVAAAGVLALGAVVLLAWIASAARAQRARIADDLLRIETRLDALIGHSEIRARTTEELVRSLDTAMRLAQADLRESVQTQLAETRQSLNGALGEQRTRFEQRQGEALQSLHEAVQGGMQTVQRQVGEALTRSADQLGKRVESLAETTDRRLQSISADVEKRLAEGFEKTTATFGDVLQRLTLIDAAQQKITELSSNVVSLQEVLADKRSRGAFGEVQLNALVRNLIPEGHFALQHTLSNRRVADCVLFLPPPTGTIAIDAKFPLESYQRMVDASLPADERSAATQRFKHDIRKHINDIAGRYIIPGETAEGAVMFLPSESVFAEIQAHHPDLVREAHGARVWVVSPTTMMAVLNTARAVLKDEATRKQVHIIRHHLTGLSKDFERFQTRMDKLARHVAQANHDVEDINTSARKISTRFRRIEQVELDEKREPPNGAPELKGEG